MTETATGQNRRVRDQRRATWMLAALGVAGITTLVVAGRYAYPDLQQGYGAVGGYLMLAVAVGGYVLLRRERRRETARVGLFRAVIWTSAFFLVFIAPTCIGTLASAA